MRRENERLREELETARRARRAPGGAVLARPPQRASRPTGPQAGPRLWTTCASSPADRVDVIHDAPLPVKSGLRRTRGRVVSQYQEDLPLQRPVVREFRVAVGYCRHCRRRVQRRHRLQTSDALGAAAVRLRPQALAFAVILNKQLGL